MMPENSALAVAIADLDGRIVHANDAFVTLWRLGRREELVGKRAEDFWQDSDRAAAVLRALRTDGAWRGEMIAKRGDGTCIDLEVSASMIVGRDGVPLCMMSSFIDVTDYKQMVREAREGEERFRRIFEQGPFAMAMSGRDFRFYKVNSAFCSMFGYNEKEFSTLTFREITHPDHLGVDSENIARLTRGEIPIYQTEKRYITKSGATIWGALTLSVLRSSSGDFLHYLVMIEDIDERRRAERALQRAERLQSLAYLAGGIAHDFNNLLQGIFGQIDLALRALPRDSGASHYLDEALAVSGRASALAEQLLTFAKGGEPKKEVIALRDVIKNVANFALSGSNVGCSISLPDDLWTCDADEGQLTRAIENIVINARQAMPQGGTIDISAQNVPSSEPVPVPVEPGQYVKVEVADRGDGIPEDIRAHIFDPFFTTKTLGSGLGLATAFSILKRHGGHIEVFSTLGKGSTFVLYVPSSERAFIPAARATEKVENSPRSVLLMDDNPIVRRVAGEMLSSAGHSVRFAKDGQEAICIYRDGVSEKQSFDLVILDLTVPGRMGGAEAVGKLLELDPWVVAIASSGYSDDPIMSDPERFGFKGALAKPYTRDDLLRIVATASRNSDSLGA